MTRAGRDAAYADIHARLTEATRMRAVRDTIVDTPNGPEMAWASYERGIVHNAVNRHRVRLGLPPVDIAAIEAIDNTAAGHVDWLHKVALRAADLAVGKEN